MSYCIRYDVYDSIILIYIIFVYNTNIYYDYINHSALKKL